MPSATGQEVEGSPPMISARISCSSDASQSSGKSSPNFISIRTVSIGLGWTQAPAARSHLPRLRRRVLRAGDPSSGPSDPKPPAVGPVGHHRGQRRRATLLSERPQGVRAGGKTRYPATRGAARRGSCRVALVLGALMHALGLPVCPRFASAPPPSLPLSPPGAGKV